MSERETGDIGGADLHELAAAYALDALDDLERRRFENHLDNSPETAAEVASYSEVAASLVESEAVPPPSLKASVLDAIANEPQLGPVEVQQETPVTESPSPTQLVPPAKQAPTQLGEVPQPTGGAGANRWPLLVAAVLVAVVAVAALGVVVSNSTGDDPNSEVAAVVEAPDAVSVALHSDDPARAGTDLAVVHSASHGATVVVGDHVHGTAPDLVYQLWGETAAGMEPAGVFVPGEDGIVEIPVNAELDGVESWNVTVEPLGGSEEPTTDIVFTSVA